MALGIEPKTNSRLSRAPRVRTRFTGRPDFKTRRASDEHWPIAPNPPSRWRTRYRLDDCQASLYQEPEKMLMFAALVDAVSCFQKLSSGDGMPQNRKWLEAKNWLWSNRVDWPFSFRNVCEALGFDPDYLRRGLLGQNPMRRLGIRSGEINRRRLKQTYRSGY